MDAQDEVVTMIRRNRSKRPRLSLTISTTSSSTADLSDTSQSTIEEEEDMANCLILLAKTAARPIASAAAEVYHRCKTCNKSFLSFQALGGHSASHKKQILTAQGIKNPLTREDKRDDFQSDGRDDTTTLSVQKSNKSRVHECSICRAEFASGQALGGHMRRHRPIPAAAAKPKSGDGESEELKRPRNILSLDLNLPAPEDDHAESNKFPFAAKEQVIVFSAGLAFG